MMRLFIPQPINWRNPINRGLTSWWKVTTVPGGSVFRDLAKRNNLTLTNSPEFSTFKLNSHAVGSIKLISASSTELSSPILTSLWDGDNWSFGGWFYQSSFSSYTRRNAFAGSGAGPSIWNDPGGALALVHTATIDFSTGYTITAGVWTHIFFSRAGSLLKCFINGIKFSEDAAFAASYTGVDTIYWGRGEAGYAEYYNGYMDDLRLYGRGIADAEAYEIYRDSLGGNKDTLEWSPSRVLFLPEAGAGAFTATAACTVGAATASASATFAAGTKTATAAVTVGPATAAGNATFTAPVYTGSSAVSSAPATASGSATFSPGTKTATATVSCAPATASGSATFAAGTKTATATVSCGAATASGSATFAAGTKTATAAVTVGPATASGSATFTAPVYTATAGVSTAPVTASGNAQFATAIRTASSAVTLAATTVSISATFAPGNKTGAAAVTIAGATCSIAATFTPIDPEEPDQFTINYLEQQASSTLNYMEPQENSEFSLQSVSAQAPFGFVELDRAPTPG